MGEATQLSPVLGELHHIDPKRLNGKVMKVFCGKDVFMFISRIPDKTSRRNQEEIGGTNV
eukprot:TRINITY_DN4463_c0_g1_i1.p2 TRINITY_DN4463_c0_g1~~TRINITY_DN4463_c0_g1_i1.p2  ORF type:complete len:60 (-),score=10.95 TRINITY_DN4463_c0_g1_i1:47-226(-)